MTFLQYDFKASDSFTMEQACCDALGQSTNPAPSSQPCIYLIHNFNSNQTYVGYANDAKHRWVTRTEVFHCLGIEAAYAQNVLCALCIPHKSAGAALQLEGTNGCEHLLARAVAGGVLGKTTSTNTKLGFVPCQTFDVDEIRIYLPKLKWGHLDSQRAVKLPHTTY
jgi:hypothetical protein